MTLAIKLWTLVFLFTAGMLAVALSGLYSASKLSENMRAVSKDTVPRLEVIARMGIDARTYRARQFQYLSSPTREKRDELQKKIAESVEDMAKSLDSYSALMKGKDKGALEELRAKWLEYLKASERMAEIYEREGAAEAFKYVDHDIRPIFVDGVQAPIESMAEWNKTEAAKLDAEGVRLRQASTYLLVGITGLCALIGALIATFTVRSIVRNTKSLLDGLASLRDDQMTQLMEAMTALENADLSRGVDADCSPVIVNTRDELGKMADSFNSLQEQVVSSMRSYEAARRALVNLVSDVRENADQVTESSRVLAYSTEQSGLSATEIASGSEKLAHSASDAAAAMERFKAAIADIEQESDTQNTCVSKADENVERAREAVESVSVAATQMASIAQSGGQAVNETIRSMEAIREQVEATAHRVRDLDEKGQQIGQIVSTIEAIAEQTNLLALNAAIEAARAGDAGRGFAVVADEVRKLAEQSTIATKEIGSLIENVRGTVSNTVQAISQAEQRVDEGTSQSHSAGAALTEIVQSATAVADQLRQVTLAAEELDATMVEVRNATERTAQLTVNVSEDVKSVSSAILEVASISQESAAGAEELSATTEEVSASAGELTMLAEKLRGSAARFRLENEPQLEVLRPAA